MIAMALPKCVVPTYDRDNASANKRHVERFLRLRCKLTFCSGCDGYHVLYDDGGGMYEKMDARHRRILEMVAMGLRDPEIAADLGISVKQVEHAVTRLSRRLNAISRPNLVAIAVALGIINPNAFIAATKEIP